MFDKYKKYCESLAAQGFLGATILTSPQVMELMDNTVVFCPEPYYSAGRCSYRLPGGQKIPQEPIRYNYTAVNTST